MALGKETCTASEVVLDLNCPCFATLGLQTPRPSWTPAKHAVSDFLSLILPRTFLIAVFLPLALGPPSALSYSNAGLVLRDP